MSAGAPAKSIEGMPVSGRYGITEPEDGSYLTCGNSSNLRLYVQRGLTVTPNTRSEYPRQTIFLDGVYNDAPFLDNETRQYSLDHHAGCVRVFTLATCEQAAVMLLEGVPLDEGEWQIYINDPDLDAVLAAWILLNHPQLRRDNASLLHKVMPFVRVEGVIDAHGFGRSALSGLAKADFEAHKARIDQVSAEERLLKSKGVWETVDLLSYTQRLFEKIDAVLYPQGDLDKLLEIREVARTELKKGGLAVLCQSSQGIYAVEAELKQRFGRRLGLVILDNGHQRFTLLQTDVFLARNLRDLYDALNRKDDRARPPENAWGGSDRIGGSPRATGTSLGGKEILEIVRKVYQGGNWFQRVARKIWRKRDRHSPPH